MDNYIDIYEEKWKHLVGTDGKLDLDKVMRELADYSMIMKNYSIVLEKITKSRISYLTTSPKDILRVHEEGFFDKTMFLDDAMNCMTDEGKVELDDLFEYLDVKMEELL